MAWAIKRGGEKIRLRFAQPHRGAEYFWQATEEAIRIRSSWMKVSFKAVAMGTERQKGI